jgi:hypothetical protein
MRTRVLTTLSPALALALVLLSGQPAQAQPRLCANTYGGDVISATNVPCRTARHIVRSWAVGYRNDGRVSRRVEGFRCRGRNDSVEGLTIRCRRGSARIRFYANVPA